MRKVFMFSFLAAGLGLSACGGNQQSNESSDTAAEVIEATKTEPAQKVKKEDVVLKDYGANPTVLNIEDYTLDNTNFRTTLWTGKNLQVTLMAIPVDGEVGLEVHHDIDQFLRIEEGSGTVYMGDAEDNLDFVRPAGDDDAVFVPAGKWHNIKNTGDTTLKLYSIYAPKEHPFGTVHVDKAASDADEHDH